MQQPAHFIMVCYRCHQQPPCWHSGDYSVTWIILHNILLVQETCSSIANTLGLCLSCTNPSIQKLCNKLCLREVRRSATHLYLLLMGSCSHSNNAPCTQQKFHVNYLGVPCWTVTSELPLSAGGRKWSLYPQGAGRTSLPIVPTITCRLLASTLTTHQGCRKDLPAHCTYSHL